MLKDLYTCRMCSRRQAFLQGSSSTIREGADRAAIKLEKSSVYQYVAINLRHPTCAACGGQVLSVDVSLISCMSLVFELESRGCSWLQLQNPNFLQTVAAASFPPFFEECGVSHLPTQGPDLKVCGSLRVGIFQRPCAN
jgi:hypothetical protein